MAAILELWKVTFTPNTKYFTRTMVLTFVKGLKQLYTYIFEYTVEQLPCTTIKLSCGSLWNILPRTRTRCTAHTCLKFLCRFSFPHVSSCCHRLSIVLSFFLSLHHLQNVSLSIVISQQEAGRVQEAKRRTLRRGLQRQLANLIVSSFWTALLSLNFLIWCTLVMHNSRNLQKTFFHHFRLFLSKE